MSDALVLSFSQIAADDLPVVGGKGANLGVLAAMGMPVPSGFCVTTRAFSRFVAGDATYDRLLGELEGLAKGDLEGASRLGEALRQHLVSRAVPDAIQAAIRAAYEAAPDVKAWAVRSSATAEDLPGASFAGQQDTFLNVVGLDSVIEHVRACWASLYTDRAILYRLEQGIAHSGVTLSAVVQRMIQPIASGILFTADPISGHRGVMAIDSGFGLGEAFVSGTVSADLFRVDRRTGDVVEQVLARKTHAIVSLPGGGTEERELGPDEQQKPSLDPAQLAALRTAGDAIERAQGAPQDIEWCFDEQGLHIVQARPITSLYPLPTEHPEPNRLWFCFNHFQVMTDAMPPLACDIWRMLMPFGRNVTGDPRPAPGVRTAGGRLYVDLGPAARVGPLRHMMKVAFPKVDALAAAALDTVVGRPEFGAGPRASLLAAARFFAPRMISLQQHLWFKRVEGVLESRNAWIEGIVTRDVTAISSGTLVERATHARLHLADLFGQLMHLPAVVLAGVISGALVRKLLPGHDADVDALSRGLDGNVTVLMDLDVGDLADVARTQPAVAAALLADEPWEDVDGAPVFAEALRGFLERWGMRATSEIDFSRPRWRDDPASILSAVAGNLATGVPGGHRTHHRELAAAGEAAQVRLIEAAGRGLLGWLRRPLVRRLTRVARALTQMREHPKLAIIRVGDATRDLAHDIGARLVEEERLGAVEDVWFLSWEELESSLTNQEDLRPLIEERRATFVRHQALYPPRVMTGEGEVPRATHDQDVPEGALAGTAASSGVVEGVARVILDPRKDVLHKGEILIAPFTDPGWTPLFINAAGLVMEVGGLMTHGSVVAREYGIPAVVCVPDVTTRIATGQRVRVNGTEGWVQILDDQEATSP